MRYLSLVFLCVTVFSCKTSLDIYNVPAFSSGDRVHAVIEIPAGTSTKIEYDLDSKTFVPDQRNGKDRVIDFLPYPGNYGFIPGTYSDPKKGGDGDALDILVLCPSLKTGTVVEVIPIGMLNLIDAGEIDTKILAIPADSALQTITAKTLGELREKYPKVEDIILTWFLNYDPVDGAEIKGVSDEQTAMELVKRSLKTSL